MVPWAALLGSLALNWHQHKRGKQTICAYTRAKLPAFAVDAALTAGYLLLRDHVLSGYERSA